MEDKDNFYAAFGKNLTEAFERSGKSVVSVSAHTGFSINELLAWQEGYKPPVIFHRLYKLCEALGITADELFSGLIVLPPFFRDDDCNVYAVSRTTKKPYKYYVVSRNKQHGWTMYYNDLFDDQQSAGNFLKGKAVSNLWRKN